MRAMKEIYVSPIARCTNCGENCGEYIKEIDNNIERYFSGHSIVCQKCITKLDWWKVVHNEIHDNFMLNSAFMQIGAKSKIFTLVLKPNKRTNYKLSDYGIPESAKVLYINYTPYTEGGNGYFPIEMTGNIPTRKYSRSETVLWPVPIGEGNAEYTEVSVYVTWVEHSDLDESWGNLVSAFEHYSCEEYESCIVPANVAVESTLSIYLTSYLQNFAGKDRVKTFLEDGATYSHQLNVVLPILTKLNGVAELPSHIRSGLNKLRALRNQMAHNGKTDKPLTKEVASEVLCSSLFGFRYIQYIKGVMSDNKI
jgi:hypothetical protein